MLKYLVILLDDTACSFCYYNQAKEIKLISLEYLKSAIHFGMMENLNIQFVYPNYFLPKEYTELIDSVSHSNIAPIQNDEFADVLVADEYSQLSEIQLRKETVYLLKITLTDLSENYKSLAGIAENVAKLNLLITDVIKFSDADLTKYQVVMEALAREVQESLLTGKGIQLNILTDRLVLEQMNNCNAGWESITVAPDGKFYVCPAFYYDKEGYAIGDLEQGLDIKNSQLYRLNHAPLCRDCDAYHCRRCIYLNWKTTKEVGIPSHEQCVTAHIERNASKKLLDGIRQHTSYLPGKNIKTIDYLDPFDNHKKKI